MMSGSSNKNNKSNNNNNNDDLIMNQNYNNISSSRGTNSMHAKCTTVLSEAPAFASSLTRSSVSPFSTSTASYEAHPVPPPRRPVLGDHMMHGHPVSGPVIHSSTPKSYLSQSQYSLSQSSYFVEDDAWYSGLFLNRVQTTPVFNPHSRKVRRSSTFNSDDLTVQTPSPSDSGIVELEALVREKDSEISFLRETLEQNEQVSCCDCCCLTANN
jgi:hypothetical protein